jgi:uncharacterized glyoxalase superfamily protein PhnB
MTDPFEAPFEALREPVVPVAPDPGFAARLRERLTRAVLDQGDDMAVQLTQRAPAWPPAVTPYLVVSDARAALDWYVEVFDAQQRGELFVDPDGTVGHAEVGIGDAVLMFSEASDLYPDVPVRAPDQPTTFSQSVHVKVSDVDATLARARRRGARVEREPVDQPYGRGAVFVDPFGHRWLLNKPPARATRLRQGDLARVTVVASDADRARAFYETVLEVPFTAGSVPGAWNTEETRPPIGIWSPRDSAPEVQLCFRVDDIEAAVSRVRSAGGTAGPVDRKPYGLLTECEDDQGAHFQLWQPVD